MSDMLKISDSVSVNILQAGYGDSIFISIKRGDLIFNILVDGGLASTYYNARERRNPAGPLKVLLSNMNEEGNHIDLIICTHVDDDHIGGIRKWFETDFPTADFVKAIWMNDDIMIVDRRDLNNTSEHAASVIKKMKINAIGYQNGIVKGFSRHNDFCTINVLAPSVENHNIIAHDIHLSLDNASSDDGNSKKSFTQLVKEDWIMVENTDENDASIAFELISWDGSKLLMLGDASYQDYMDGLNLFYPNTDELIKYDMVKLSHHGSKNNFHPEFLKRVYSPVYMVSTNGLKFKHPDKEVLAHIMCNADSTIMFNYIERMQQLITEQDRVEFPNIDNRIKALY